MIKAEKDNDPFSVRAPFCFVNAAGGVPDPVQPLERVLRAAAEHGPGQGPPHHRAAEAARQGQGETQAARDGQEGR